MDSRITLLLLLLSVAVLACGCTSTSGFGNAGAPQPFAPPPTQYSPPAEEPSGDPDCMALGCPAGTNYVGSMKSDKYHFCSCEWARRISPANLVCFMSADEAASSGYVPCKVCRP